jgi:DNA modification methylase
MRPSFVGGLSIWRDFMTRLYDCAGLTIYCGDSYQLLPQLPSEHFDSIVTDPPYGTTEEGKAKLTKTKDGFVEFGEEWDRELPLDWLKDACRVLKAGGSIIVWTDGKRVETLWNAMEANGLHPLRDIYWHKTNPAPNPRKNFCSAVEAGVFARKPGKVLFWGGGGFQHNMFECPIVSTYERIHPTQKPVPLMDWCIKNATPPDGLILDPFMGSGSTLQAARLGGYRAVGIDVAKSFARQRFRGLAKGC